MLCHDSFLQDPSVDSLPHIYQILCIYIPNPIGTVAYGGCSISARNNNVLHIQ